LKNFALGICGCKQDWTMSAFMDQKIERVRKLVSEKGQVLGAVSGSVDSTVAAKLMKGHRIKILGSSRLQLRLNGCKQVQKDLSEHLGINFTVVDASQQFLCHYP
jgi:GMP synthase (glutamine-hydrolysing)